MTVENADGDAARRPPEYTEAWQDALAYWRGYTAEMFDHSLKQQVQECVARTNSTIEEWRAAIRGDAAAAIKVALRMRMPDQVDTRLDLIMTVLLAAAFEDGAAASVMAQLVDRAPLDPVDRAGLSTSWLIHEIWCESRIRNARRRRRLHRPVTTLDAAPALFRSACRLARSEADPDRRRGGCRRCPWRRRRGRAQCLCRLAAHRARDHSYRVHDGKPRILSAFRRRLSHPFER